MLGGVSGARSLVGGYAEADEQAGFQIGGLDFHRLTHPANIALHEAFGRLDLPALVAIAATGDPTHGFAAVIGKVTGLDDHIRHRSQDPQRFEKRLQRRAKSGVADPVKLGPFQGVGLHGFRRFVELVERKIRAPEPPPRVVAAPVHVPGLGDD